MNDLMSEMASVHSEMVFGVIPSEIDKLIKKYNSVGIKEGLASLKNYIFIVLADMCCNVTVEDTIYQINKYRNEGKDNKTIADILNIREENIEKLLMGWDVING